MRGGPSSSLRTSSPLPLWGQEASFTPSLHCGEASYSPSTKPSLPSPTPRWSCSLRFVGLLSARSQSPSFAWPFNLLLFPSPTFRLSVMPSSSSSSLSLVSLSPFTLPFFPLLLFALHLLPLTPFLLYRFHLDLLVSPFSLSPLNFLFFSFSTFCSSVLTTSRFFLLFFISFSPFILLYLSSFPIFLLSSIFHFPHLFSTFLLALFIYFSSFSFKISFTLPFFLFSLCKCK